MAWLLQSVTLWTLLLHVLAHVRDLEVSEGVPRGTLIGFIDDGSSTADYGPPYLIVPVTGSQVDSDLQIDQSTGEIRTKVELDRETRASYSLVAIPLSGKNIPVNIKVLDENDNAPTFPAQVMHIEFPENTPRDVKRTLNPAKDLDLEPFNTQTYNILSGNVNNAFRLSSHRERDGVLYLDLQINGFLDRETTEAYSLIIEALDGGKPPLRGEMLVNITIQDINDNQPIFNQSRYFANIPENSTVGTSVLQVFATDRDASANGEVEYSINRRQSDRESMFKIDSRTGVIRVNKPLDFETKELHELVIVAKDHGQQPLETTTFVSIRVTDVNDNRPTINVIFLSDDATPKISESAAPGEFVARISVNDPDSKTAYSNINVTLLGGDGHFGLTTHDNVIYLVIVSLPLDRESKSNYSLNVVATDTGTPPLHASTTIHLQVTDENDNAPQFDRPVYQANVMEVSDPGSSVIQVHADDQDEGNNSAITYGLLETHETHSTWFQIDAKTGLITTRAHVDCETDSQPQLIVTATDNGTPAMSSTATVIVTIHDVNDNEPIFDQSFYNGTVAENEAIGKCILKVSATDPDCGINAIVNYTLGDRYGRFREFTVQSDTGNICIAAKLDYETRQVYEIPVVATDRGGLSTTAMVKIQVTDVNDNYPVFYPREYNVSLRENDNSFARTSSGQLNPVVVVAATDLDSGRFGAITYRIIAGNNEQLFDIDRFKGEISVKRPNLLSTRTQSLHHLNISATDGGGLRAQQDAEVFISILNAAQRPPIFEKPRYQYSIRENVRRFTVVGNVKATNIGSGYGTVKYSIYSGDPDGYFTIDPVSGTIQTASELDHEAHASLLLNVQATSGIPPAYGHTQVRINIEDVNDNAPEFESNMIRLSIPENVELNQAIYIAHATDRDSGKNGQVTYRLSVPGGNQNGGYGGNVGGLFDVNRDNGTLTLAKHLDYEQQQRHTLMITATDMGQEPNGPLSSDLSITVEVQDINDNPPKFERNEYFAKVLETLPVNSEIIEVTAVDLDTGNNARLTYRIIKNSQDLQTTTQCATFEEQQRLFGLFPNSGVIYLKDKLDRERCEQYDLTVAVSDNGTPSMTATASVKVFVLDANDNDPKFSDASYNFEIEENLRRNSFVGRVHATDADLGMNAMVYYSLIPSNSSFLINSATGEIVTKEPLDREQKQSYDLIAEARDQGTPSPRASRVPIHIRVLDVNDNAPEIVDPQEDVVSVREAQPPDTEVVRVRAVDQDDGANATIVYSILKGKDSDGAGAFAINPSTGVIRTKITLDHEEKTIFRLAVAATDNGSPPKQSIRLLRVEVLDLNDNRPTFSSSSLVFRIREDAPIGYIVGSVANQDIAYIENGIPNSSNGLGSHITYTLSTLPATATSTVVSYQEESYKTLANVAAFEIDRSTGSLVVARKLDRELQSEYRLEVRALDTTTMNNPQSSAVTVRIDIDDVNDNPPLWSVDPIIIKVPEDTPVGSLIGNLTATDKDTGTNGEIRYSLIGSNQPTIGSKSQPTTQTNRFQLDTLTGSLVLLEPLDYEATFEHVLIVKAMDQSSIESDRLTTSVTVRIIVLDANDNAPKFVLPVSSNVMIGNNLMTGMTICHVLAIDKDSGENGHVTYNLDPNPLFSINYDTGVLTLSRTLENVDDVITLNITASDRGNPPRKTLTALKIFIQNPSVNTSPKFLNNVYYGNVSENSPPGTFVINVSANSFFPTKDTTNLTYEIPPGAGRGHFKIDSTKGVVTTTTTLDREELGSYTIPVFVRESPAGGPNDLSVFNARVQDDVTTLVINVVDMNDHAPEFRTGSCYPLSVPENGENGVIHTVLAVDLDSGANAELSYGISGGNIGNKFFIDPNTGDLVAKQLDRETQNRYVLTITAHDHGSQQLRGSCNITIHVGDENDNEPIFDRTKYAISIAENVQIGSSILTVHATDLDVGVNSKIMYSLSNTTDWRFQIDNKTGVITTIGEFDREKQDSYNFYVVASDSGKYISHSHRVPVEVSITDVNDNAPYFLEHPLRRQLNSYVQPGQTLFIVHAADEDDGVNADILYTLVSSSYNGKFRINPNTGALTASQNLASENGKTIRLEVVATDKGNPPQSCRSLIELKIGNESENSLTVRFPVTTYNLTLNENSPHGKQLIQVNAVRSDGRKQNVAYKIINNHDDIFEVNRETGWIRVMNSSKLDYEQVQMFHLVVEAETTDIYGAKIFGYCHVYVTLRDVNDNSPRFMQNQYNVAVKEGLTKGTFVTEVTAVDLDSGLNSRILYHILDGNHDNAFVIEPAFSGLVKTNIVLDREIRDVYMLTVIATDDGVPQMTGTATVQVRVIDVNDNRPTFPPHNVITISEGTEVGTTLTAITANDVDSYPPLTYTFTAPHLRADRDIDEDNEVKTTFSIDRFSGKIILRHTLDFELCKEHTLNVFASDNKHLVNTSLIVRVSDVNDNAPAFQQLVYYAVFPEKSYKNIVDVIQVNATDVDTGANALIKYSLLNDKSGFSVDENTGVVYVNRTFFSASQNQLKERAQLEIVASDSGNPQLSAITTVNVHVNSGPGVGFRSFKNALRLNVAENCSQGIILTYLTQPDMRETVMSTYIIAAGNDDGHFEIVNPGGALVLIKTLDREITDSYDLNLIPDSDDEQMTDPFYLKSNINTSIHIHITVDDANDNAPTFSNTTYQITISESLPINSHVLTATAIDSDAKNTDFSQVRYEITSGNDLDHFRINATSGAILVKKPLDYDVLLRSAYHLLVRACDKAPVPLCSFATVLIRLDDENDNAPTFPVVEYLEVIGENEPVGTVIFAAHATDLDRGKFGALNYSIASVSGGQFVGGVDEIVKNFRINSKTGVVSSNVIFDYEQVNRYNFLLKATDIGGKFATARVKIDIDSRDEFYPQFTERTYHMAITALYLPAGFVVGYVVATDRDKGPDGRVVYQLATQHAYFKMNRTTGALTIRKKIDNAGNVFEFGRELSLVVTASSGRQGSLTNMTVVEVTLDPLADSGTNLASVHRNNTTGAIATSNSVVDWLLGLFVSLLIIIITFGSVLLFIYMKSRKHKKINKPNLGNHRHDTTTVNNYVDPSSFDTIPVRGNHGGHSGHTTNHGLGTQMNLNQLNQLNQFAPPKYDEIPPYGPGNVNVNLGSHHPGSSNSGAATQSELSGSEQSGSSGRGSAEDDGEDEEIRMINEGPRRRNGDGDNISDVSVHNTQEYLARLGIVDTSHSSTAAARLCSEALGSAISSNSQICSQGSQKAKDLGLHQIPLDSLRIYDEDAVSGDADLTHLIYAKLNEVNSGSVSGGAGSNASEHGGSTADDNLSVGTNILDVQSVKGARNHHALSMNGSLSSIVHSEEELTGSYNWDYLLDWGPQYQPLAHVFSEIARLKDDTNSVESAANSTTSSVKSKNSSHHPPIIKNNPPAHITNIVPIRNVPSSHSMMTSSSSSSSRSSRPPTVLTSSMGNMGHGSNLGPNIGSNHGSNLGSNHGSNLGANGHQMILMPRSPIGHDPSGAGFTNSTAMSPSFSPALSPLASSTKSPSISPMGMLMSNLSSSQSHHLVPLSRQQQRKMAGSGDKELRM